MIILFTSCSKEDDGIYFEDTNATIETSYVTYSPIETEILELINIHRETIGLNKLSTLNIVSQVAEDHTEYMVETGNVNHDNFQKRVQLLKQNASAKTVGENVAYGFASASGVVKGWLNSPEHKKIIENPDYTHFGISTECNNDGRNYFTHIFINK
ncbi:MAG TPA: CAP domain-containing protein [Flavobacteriaceae bacterium]|nr:CAP domain-containing protein [Flavobacteriaceae bacterium]